MTRTSSQYSFFNQTFLRKLEMMATAMLEELKKQIEAEGDFRLLLRSEEFEFEPVKWTEFVEHDGERGLLVD